MTEKQVNKIRNRVQKEALAAIEKSKHHDMLFMATGSGKSKIPIEYAKKKKNKVKKLALIVPTERLRDEDWKNEFIKWGAEELWENTVRLCYASASKVALQDFDLVILDECHNITELSFSFFMNNTFKKIIGLSATPPTEFEKVNLLRRIGLYETYSLSLDDAVAMGFVAPYKITVVYTKLDEVNKNVLSGNKENPFYNTEYKNYIWLTNQINLMDFNGQTNTKKYQAYVLKRMRAIYNLKSKTAMAHKILAEKIPSNDRTLIFAGSIDQAEELCPYRYHSKSGKEDLNKFTNLEIDRLSCVQALNEGANIPAIDSAVIVQVNSKERHLVQRIGRLIRYRPGHEAHIWIICCKDTQDEVWLSSSLENINKDIIDFIYT